MAKVIGLGGVFFRSEDPEALRAWYGEHLGMDVSPHGTTFLPRSMPAGGYNIWSAFPKGTNYFGESGQSFMVNLIVDDVQGCLDSVAHAGAKNVKGPELNEYGGFAWFEDPDGNRIELWQPPAELPDDVK